MTRVSTQIEDDMLEKLHPADHTHNLNTKLHKTHYKMYKITCAVHHQLYAECNFCLPAPFTRSMSHYSPTRPIRTADDFHRDIIFCLASQCRRMIRYTGSIAVQMSSGNTMIMNTCMQAAYLLSNACFGTTTIILCSSLLSQEVGPKKCSSYSTQHAFKENSMLFCTA